jgi:hypothetical protein
VVGFDIEMVDVTFWGMEKHQDYEPVHYQWNQWLSPGFCG